MSGSATRTVAIRLTLEQADAVRRGLESIGRDGSAALRQIESASSSAGTSVTALAGVSDAAARTIGRLDGAFGGLGASALRASSGLSGAAAGMAALGAGAVASGVAIAKMGDAYTATMQRLGSATGSVEAASRAYDSLYQLSQKTGVAITESAGAFSRFAVAAKDIGATQSQVVDLVATIQKAGILSGGSAQETGAAVQQLGQALASGKLQGDELRSLLENMPQLAQKLAQELGVGIGQLREMGSEGKLTADTVFPALLRAGEKLNEEFDKLAPTMGRSFDILGSSMVSFGANLDKALGLSQAIAAAAQAAAGAVNSVRRYILPTDSEASATKSAAEVKAAEDLARNLRLEQRARVGGGHSDEVQMRTQHLSDDALMQRIAEQDRIIHDGYERRERTQAEFNARDDKEQAGADARKRDQQTAANAKTAEALILSLDKRAAAEKKYTDSIGKIQESRDAGAMSAGTAQHLAEIALAEKTQALTEKTEHAKTAAVRKGAEDRRAAYDEPYLDPTSGLLLGSDAEVKAAHQAKAAAAKWVSANESAQSDITKAAEREEEKRQRVAERSTDDIVRYSGDMFADLFATTGGGWDKMWKNMQTTAIATLARIVAEAAVRPIVTPIVGAFMGASGSASGSASSGSSMVTLGKDIYNAGKSLYSVYDNVASTGSFFGPETTGAINAWGSANLGTGAGMSAESIAAMSPESSFAAASYGSGEALGGTSLAGAASLAGAGIAGVSGGYMLGGMIGNAINPGHEDQTQVGSAAGALAGAAIGSIIPGIGTALGLFIGGLVGGAGGGALGSMFGPGAPHNGWGFHATADASGQIRSTDEHYNDVAKEKWTADMANMAKVNAFMAAHAIQASGESIVGGNNTGVAGQVDDFGNTAGAFKFSTTSDSASLKTVLDRVFASYSDLEDAVNASTNFDTLTASAPVVATIGSLDTAISQINTTFDAVTASAVKYGLSEDALNAARAKAIAATNAEADAVTTAYLASYTTRQQKAVGQDTYLAVKGADAAGVSEIAALGASYKAIYGDAYATVGKFQDALAALTTTLTVEHDALLRTFNKAQKTSDQNYNSRILTANGNTAGAALYANDNAAANELQALADTYAAAFGAAYLGMTEYTDAVRKLTAVLTLERAALVLSQAQAAQATAETGLTAAQTAEKSARDAYVNAIQAHISTLQSNTDALVSVASGLHAYIRGMATGANSPLSPEAQLIAAKQAFATDAAAAQNGDQAAAGRLGGDSDTMLGKAAAYYGKASSQYAELFQDTNTQLTKAEAYYITEAMVSQRTLDVETAICNLAKDTNVSISALNDAIKQAEHGNDAGLLALEKTVGATSALDLASLEVIRSVIDSGLGGSIVSLDALKQVTHDTGLGDVEAINALIDQTENSGNGLGEVMKGVATTLVDAQKDPTSIGGVNDKLQAMIDAAALVQTPNDATLHGIIDAVTAGGAATGGSLETLADNYQALVDAAQATSGSLTSMSGAVTAGAGSVTSMSGAVSGAGDSITGLSGAVTASGDAVTALSGAVSGSAGSLTSMSGAVTASGGAITGLSGAVTASGDSVSKMADAVSGSATSLSGLSGAVSGSSDSVSKMSGAVSSGADSVSAMAKALSEQGSPSAAIETMKTAMATAISDGTGGTTSSIHDLMTAYSNGQKGVGDAILALAKAMELTAVAKKELDAVSTPTHTATVAADYQSMLGRAPVGAESAPWVAQLDAGATNATVQASIAQTPEYLVRQDYLALLNRAPDAAGMKTWTDAMTQKGWTNAMVQASIKTLPEYKSLHGLAAGGWVSNGAWNEDSVIAMTAGGAAQPLAGGEYVVSAPAAAQFADILPVINRGSYSSNDNSSQAVLAELRAVRLELAELRKTTAAVGVHVGNKVAEGTAIAAGGQATTRLRAAR
jgi:tape measure domain-containing protein